MWEYVKNIVAPPSVPNMQQTGISASNMSQESDLDSAPASYKSNWSAVIFQKPLSSSQNKHILGTCCGVPCLFLHSARLAVSLGEVNHMFQLFLCIWSALLLLLCATVRVIVYTQKKVSLFISLNLVSTLCTGPESNNSFCFVLALFGNLILNLVVWSFYSQS